MANRQHHWIRWGRSRDLHPVNRQYCAKCGRVQLKNEASRKWCAQPCTWEDD